MPAARTRAELYEQIRTLIRSATQKAEPVAQASANNKRLDAIDGARAESILAQLRYATRLLNILQADDSSLIDETGEGHDVIPPQHRPR